MFQLRVPTVVLLASLTFGMTRRPPTLPLLGLVLPIDIPPRGIGIALSKVHSFLVDRRHLMVHLPHPLVLPTIGMTDRGLSLALLVLLKKTTLVTLYTRPVQLHSLSKSVGPSQQQIGTLVLLHKELKHGVFIWVFVLLTGWVVRGGAHLQWVNRVSLSSVVVP